MSLLQSNTVKSFLTEQKPTLNEKISCQIDTATPFNLNTVKKTYLMKLITFSSS